MVGTVSETLVVGTVSVSGLGPGKTPLVPHSQVPDGSPGMEWSLWMDETEIVTLVVTVMMQDEVDDDDHDCLIKNR